MIRLFPQPESSHPHQMSNQNINHSSHRISYKRRPVEANPKRAENERITPEMAKSVACREFIASNHVYGTGIPKKEVFQYRDIVQQLKEVYDTAFDDEITAMNLMPRVVKLMQWVDDFYYATGPEKERAVIGVAELVIREGVPNTTPAYDILEVALLAMVPQVMHFLIEVEKGRLVVSPEAKSVFSCFPCCRPKATARNARRKKAISKTKSLRATVATTGLGKAF